MFTMPLFSRKQKKSTRECPGCKAMISDGCAFCPSCGCSIAEAAEKIRVDGMIACIQKNTACVNARAKAEARVAARMRDRVAEIAAEVEPFKEEERAAEKNEEKADREIRDARTALEKLGFSRVAAYDEEDRAWKELGLMKERYY